MANRTTLVDNNTWNNSHIALVGKAMSSTEDKAYKIMRMLGVDYVLVIFGGVIGYSGDDINKFLWMVRIAEGEHPQDIKVSTRTVHTYIHTCMYVHGQPFAPSRILVAPRFTALSTKIFFVTSPSKYICSYLVSKCCRSQPLRFVDAEAQLAEGEEVAKEVKRSQQLALSTGVYS